MTGGSPGRRLATPVLALAVALATVGAVPVPATAGGDHDGDRLSRRGPEPTLTVRDTAGAGSTVKRVTLQWRGGTKNKRRSKTFAIPGIGQMTFTCRPNQTRISLRAGNRDRETQMWLAKYEDKSYGRAVAVKTVRVFRYAHANDDGRGGTSNPQHEGLNQRGGRNGVENYAKGYAHGVISQRAGRNVATGARAMKPVTTFDLNWYWNGFDHPARYRTCRFDGVFVTTPARIGVDWHGEADARDNDLRLVRVPGLGSLELRCEPDRHGRRTVSLIPDDLGTRAYVELVEGEGRVSQHVETRTRLTDRETGRLGPMELPGNGMMRFFFDSGRRTTPFVLSSIFKVNDPDPRLNFCETAMGQFPR
jgi:hypothetical protein